MESIQHPTLTASFKRLVWRQLLIIHARENDQDSPFYLLPKEIILDVILWLSKITISKKNLDWEVRKEFIGHTKGILSLQIKQNTIYSSSYDGGIRIWSTTSGECLHYIPAHRGAIYSLQMSNENLLFSTGHDKTIKIWNYNQYYNNNKNLENNICFTPIQTLQTNHNTDIYTMKLSEDQKSIYTGSMDGSIKQFDITTQKCITTFQAHSNWVRQIDIHNNILYSSSSDGKLKLWDLSNLPSSNSSNSSSSNSSNNNSNSSNSSNLISSNSSKLIREMGTSNLDIWTFQISPKDGLVFCGCFDSTIKVYNIEAGKMMINFNSYDHGMTRHTRNVTALQIVGDVMFSASADRTVKLWDLGNGHCLKSLVEGEYRDDGMIRCLTVSGDDLFTATDDKRAIGGNTIKLWNLHF